MLTPLMCGKQLGFFLRPCVFSSCIQSTFGWCYGQCCVLTLRFCWWGFSSSANTNSLHRCRSSRPPCIWRHACRCAKFLTIPAVSCEACGMVQRLSHFERYICTYGRSGLWWYPFYGSFILARCEFARRSRHICRACRLLPNYSFGPNTGSSNNNVPLTECEMGSVWIGCE